MAAIVLALLLSLGLRLYLGNIQPYQWIRDYVPGFHQLRSPFRFAVVVQIFLVLLAGFGLSNLKRWFPGYGTLFSVILTVLVLLESVALPLPLQPIPNLQTDAAWQVWLNQQEQPPQIIMLPFAANTGVVHFEQTTRWMLESRYIQGQMLNGYSGFFPPDHARLRDLMLQFPTVDGLDLLRELNVDYVVVHYNLANAPPVRRVENSITLVFVDNQAGVSIYALNS